MNVYDFDKTIYARDCTVDFYFFVLKKHPGILRFLPRQLRGALFWAVGKRDTTELKEAFFSFLQAVDARALAEAYWKENLDGICSWYRSAQRRDDVIISASPRFLLEPVCERLGITHLLASETDPRTGKFTGENCYGPEKVRRFQQAFPTGAIECFYSDSLSDLPLARCAQQAFRVIRGKPQPWKMPPEKDGTGRSAARQEENDAEKYFHPQGDRVK